MNRLLVLFALFLFSCNEIGNNSGEAVKGISKMDLSQTYTCNYDQTLQNTSVYNFQSDSEANKAMNSILKKVGIPPNFTLVASDINNAAAVIHKTQRYILYNQLFMEQVKQMTGSDFGPISILAHEIGHHLSGHTLLQSDGRHQLELEADKFSGFILGRMGASINEALLAINKYSSVNASSTHPGRNSRIAAITNGWKEAEEQEISSVVTQVPAGKAYHIDVKKGHGYITIRNRNLSPDEYKIANSGTPEGVILNKETVLANLVNGTRVDILSSVGRTFYVKAYTIEGELLGYIAKSFAGLPTINEVMPSR